MKQNVRIGLRKHYSLLVLPKSSPLIDQPDYLLTSNEVFDNEVIAWGE